MPDLAVVTGALSYTGRAVARELRARGLALRTLTNRRVPLAPLDGTPRIEARPLQFEDPSALEDALRGARLLVNTYWVRYPFVGVSFERAVENTEILLQAARRAGVTRVVHISVSNPSLRSKLGYYRGKAIVEERVHACGLPFAIVRPTLIVGEHDILVNNIAWFLRNFPIFAMPGSGHYRLQPITLDDVGRIVADAALLDESVTLDAAGPEVMTFEELVRAIAAATGQQARILHVPPWFALGLIRAVGWIMREVILSREELAGLMEELLVSHEPPRGTESVRIWLAGHGDQLGRRYTAELARR